MMTVETLLTLEEFLDLPDQPGSSQELLHGRLIDMSAPQADHAAVQAEITIVLGILIRRSYPDVFVLGDTGFVLGPQTLQCPDVSVVRREGYRAMSTQRGALVGAPDLAIEIVSPSESAQDLDDKVEAYLAAGSSTVWVVWPRNQHVLVHHRNGDVRKAHVSGFLEAPEVLPGASIPVASIFPIL